jgi:hypothetical protein
MRFPTLIIAAGTALALASSAATAAQAKHKPLPSSGTRTPTTAGNGDVIYTAPFGSVPIRTAHYIYIPGPASPTPYVADCATNGDGCTPEQLCDISGENC